MIYLDSGATSLLKPPAVAAAVKNAIKSCASPGRGGHAAAMRGADTVYRCREVAAELFNVPSPENVVLTMNATHSLNIAIKSCLKPGDRVVISGYEHNSVTRPLAALNARVSVAKSKLFSPEESLENFERLIRQGTDCVICSHVSNVFGYIQPVEELAELCKRYSVPLIIDASQSAGCLSVDMGKLGARFIAMPGHKGLLGPQGTGLLLCGGDSVPLMEGGTGSESKIQTMPEFLPDRLEAGTHNVPGAAGLTEGMLFVRKHTPQRILAHELKLTELAARELEQLPDVEVFSSPKRGTQTGVLSFRVKGVQCEVAAWELGRRGIAVRAGFHCSPLSHESAGTLDTGTVRVSVSPFNTNGDIKALVKAVKSLKREQ